MLEAVGLCKSFGGVEVARDISFRIEPGERRVILGPNGAGKTTLFNLIAGTLRPSAGDIRIDGRSALGLSVAGRARAGLARSYQKNTLFDSLTVRENLLLASSAAQGKSRRLFRDSFRDQAVREAVAETAAAMRLEDLLEVPVRNAAYGDRRRLEVGIALAARPRILLMDEPTSGVGPERVAEFHRLLSDLPRDLTVLIIEHDMDLAFDIADRITVLNFGEVVFEGTPEETRGDRTVRDIYLGAAVDA